MYEQCCFKIFWVVFFSIKTQFRCFSRVDERISESYIGRDVFLVSFSGKVIRFLVLVYLFGPEIKLVKMIGPAYFLKRRASMGFELTPCGW